MKPEEMVEKFLCPGCVVGSNTGCGKYQPHNEGSGGCQGHVMGTVAMGIGAFALGMPRGFNRPSRVEGGGPTAHSSKMAIFTFPAGTKVDPPDPIYNVPVWKLVQDGCLFVRFAQPRVSSWMIFVIEGGDPATYPTAINMTSRYDEYD